MERLIKLLKSGILPLAVMAILVPWLSLGSKSLDGSQLKEGIAIAATDNKFEAEVLKSTKPVLVDFWAPWCGPCRAYGPIVDQVARDYSGKLKVVRVDIDDNAGLSKAFHIEAIPTSLLFSKGKVVHQWVGLVSDKDLRSEVDKLFLQVEK